MSIADKAPNEGNVTLSGFWTIQVFGPDGALKNETRGKNIITTVGKEYLASFLRSANTSGSWTMNYIGIGTDNTAAAVGQTALVTEVSRKTGTVSYTSGAIYNVVATFATGSGTGALIEYAVFSSSSAGTMLSRYVDSGVVTKGANDTLRAELQITFS